jgi:pimeloyl-ACP methyl ester carboxylesterase
MVPGRLSAMSKLVNPRRYMDPGFLVSIGPELYGGVFRDRPELLQEHARHIRPPRGRGYLYQLLATWGWSSLFWLRSLRQPTLIMAGTDDPIVRLVNAKFLAWIIPNARLHVVDDGHLFLISRADDVAPVIKTFLAEDAADAISAPPSIERTQYDAA